MNAHFVWIVLSSMVISLSAIAESSPEEVVAIYFKAFQQSDMATLAAHMHPDELAKFRNMMLPVMEKGLAAADDDAEGEDGMALQLFAGHDDIDVIRNESHQAFFARFMTWVMKINPMLKSSMEGAKVEPIGHVNEGDLTHVVYRMHVEMMGANITQVSAISLKRKDDTWKLMLTGEIEGMSKMLQANIEQLM